MQFEVIRGAAIEPVREAVARLRIEVFREWPYLYEGTPRYEARYLQTYAECPQSAVVLARDGDAIVGASTALPLVHAEDEFQAPFREQGLDPGRYLYLAESVLLPEYRGQGAGHRFFNEREAIARELGLPWATFCAVVRPPDHPLRPPDYCPLEGFWRKRGYAPVDGLVAEFPWPDRDQSAATYKPLQFWARRITVVSGAHAAPGPPVPAAGSG